MARHVEIDIDSSADTSGFYETGRGADYAASKVDELGDQMRGTTRESAALDVALVRTKAKIYELGQQYVKTGDEDVFKNLRDQRGILSGLQQIGTEADKISLGSLFHGAVVDVDRLRARIRETKIAVDELSAAWVKTGDKDVLKSLREQRGTLQTLQQIAKGLKDTDEAADRASTSTDRLGGRLLTTAEHAHTLEQRIGASKKAVLELGEEFLRTGDRDVFKNLREERGVLHNLQQLRKEFQTLGEGARRALDFGDLGNFSGVISAGFKALPVQAKAALVGVVVAAVPGIVAALSGAVLAGLSGLTLAGGIVAAARSAAVHDAWATFGQGLLNTLTEAASVLQGPLVQAASKFTQALDMDALRADFAAVAPLVDSLTAGLAGFFAKFQPGFLEGLKGAQPVFEALAHILPQLGEDLGQFFEILGSQGSGAANALELTFGLLGDTLVALGYVMAGAAAAFNLFGGATLLAAQRLDVFKASLVVLSAAPVLMWLHDLVLGTDQATATWHTAEEATHNLAREQELLAQALAEAKRMTDEGRKAADELAHSLRTAAQETLSHLSADLAFKQGRLDMIDALKKSKGSLDENTQAGLAAEQSLIRQAQNALAVAEAYEKRTHSIEGADAVFQEHIDQIYRDAAANGIAKEKVDAVIGSLRNLHSPDPLTIELKRKGMEDHDIQKVRNELTSTSGTYNAWLNVYHNQFFQRIFLPAEVSGSYAGPAHSGFGYSPGIAKGGILHAAMGLITQPGIYKGRGDGMVVAAEGATGSEGFVPQKGIDRDRAGALLEIMAGWHDYSVYDRQSSGYAAPMTAGGDRFGGGMAGVVVELRAATGDHIAEFLLSLLRPVVRGRYGGDIQAAAGGGG